MQGECTREVQRQEYREAEIQKNRQTNNYTGTEHKMATKTRCRIHKHVMLAQSHFALYTVVLDLIKLLKS